jgi:hypothetical protein
MKNLERALLLRGFSQNSDGHDFGELDPETWLAESENIDSLVTTVIHWCIDAARTKSPLGADTPEVRALFDLKLKGIKYLKLDYSGDS